MHSERLRASILLVFGMRMLLVLGFSDKRRVHGLFSPLPNVLRRNLNCQRIKSMRYGLVFRVGLREIQASMVAVEWGPPRSSLSVLRFLRRTECLAKWSVTIHSLAVKPKETMRLLQPDSIEKAYGRIVVNPPVMIPRSEQPNYGFRVTTAMYG